MSRILLSALIITMLFGAHSAIATILDITIDGSDAIFLAGRTDLTIPPPNLFWSVLIRHSSPTPEEIQETLPPTMPVTGGDIIQFADPAVGGISFFNGFGAPLYGPGGNGVSGSDLTSLDGISGYKGPQGPLVGVFLDASVPSSGPAPATLDFTPGGLGIDFLITSPLLDQVFYIGDGVTNLSVPQQFVAPAGATRLALGIPDGFGFVGAPGAYDDNDGSYRIRIGQNEPANPIPEPGTLLLLGTGLAGLAGWL